MTTEHANDNKAEEATTSKSDLQFDPDAETVTDAWEGVYINTNWEYIKRISDLPKSVP